MYTQNQIDIVETEQEIEYYQDSFWYAEDLLQKEYCLQRMTVLTAELKELYSKE
jgi:hypothetical protein